MFVETSRKELFRKYPDLHRNLLKLIFAEYMNGNVKRQDIEEILYRCILAVVEILEK